MGPPCASPQHVGAPHKVIPQKPPFFATEASEECAACPERKREAERVHGG